MIAFEVGPKVGLGHALRCRVLAQALAERGHMIGIFCRGPRAVITDWVWPADADIIVDDSADLTGHLLSCVDASDWIVLDGYGWWNTQIVGILRRRGAFVFAFDDAGEGPTGANLLLNQNSDLIGPVKEPHVLRGPDYALIDPVYVGARGRHALITENLKRILISFGGADRAGHTARLVNILDHNLSEKILIDVVIGPFFAEQSISAKRHELRCHYAPRHLADLMADTDLIVTAAGTTCWQACCVGLPIVAVIVAPNQMGIVATLARHEAAWTIDESNLGNESLWKEIVQPSLRRAKAKAAHALVDGTGAQRVVQAIEDMNRSRLEGVAVV